MRTSVIAVLMMLALGMALPRCGGDVDEDMLPVHVRVYNIDSNEAISIVIGPHDFGTVAIGEKTVYKEFSPLGSFIITITDSTATTNLRTGNGGYYTLIIDDKDSITNWDVVAD